MSQPIRRLVTLLESHRYISSMGIGERGLMPHHVSALTDFILLNRKEIMEILLDYEVESDES